MSQILPFILFRAFTTNGTLAGLSGGKLYSYEAGTSTPKPLYTDSSLAVALPNPVILDQYGQKEIWADDEPYKLNLTDSNDVQMSGWPIDNIQLGISGSGSISVDTIADLRALSIPSGNDPIYVYVGGYYAKGEQGGGHFYWNSTSVLSDDGGVTILPDSSPATGRWQRIFTGNVSVLDFGAEGDYIIGGSINASARDNTNQLNNTFSYCRTNNLSCRMPKGSYLVTGALNCAVSIIGDSIGKIVDNASYASTTWNTGVPNNLDGCSIIWDNTTLTPSDVYMRNVSGDDSSDVKFKNITFYSRSSGSDGGGSLFVNDSSQSGSEYNFGFEDTFENCRVVNFKVGITVNIFSNWNVDEIQFVGCQKTILAGNSTPEISTGIKLNKCSFENCGDTSTSFIDLDNVTGFELNDCLFEKTSDLNIRNATGVGVSFNRCYINDASLNSSDEFITRDQGTTSISSVIFNECISGGNSGNIDLVKSENNVTLILNNTELTGTTIDHGSNGEVKILEFGKVSYDGVTNLGTRYQFTDLDFQHTGIQFQAFSSQRQIRLLQKNSLDINSLLLSASSDGSIANGAQIELMGEDHASSSADVKITAGSGTNKGNVELVASTGKKVIVTSTDDSTSGTTGSIITNGGLGVAKDIVTNGDLICNIEGKGLEITEDPSPSGGTHTETNGSRMGVSSCTSGTPYVITNSTVTTKTRVLLSFQVTGGLSSEALSLSALSASSFSILVSGGSPGTYPVLWLLIEGK